MSEEKTEKATPKRQEDARKKGQIARGPELPAALSFLGSLLVINYLSRDIFGKVGYYIQNSAIRIGTSKDLSAADLHGMFIEAAMVFAFIALPVAAISFAAVVAGNFAQGGLTLTGAALMPKADKFSPAKNIKRIFGLDAPVNLLKSVLKLGLIVAAAYGILMPVVETAPLLIHAPLPIITAKLGQTLYNLALRCGVILLTLSLAEYGYALYKHGKSLKMSKQEIRDEYKQQEGDPMIKGQRRRRARELTQRRSMANVPTASVIVTNPTHFAVALRYDRNKDAAPLVVAKGADNVAAKIRQMAREYDIPLIENPPLARALFKAVEPNQTIPTEFFGAVAEILAFVFRQREN